MTLCVLSTADEGVDDILGMLSAADEGVDDIIGTLLMRVRIPGSDNILIYRVCILLIIILLCHLYLFMMTVWIKSFYYALFSMLCIHGFPNQFTVPQKSFDV